MFFAMAALRGGMLISHASHLPLYAASSLSGVDTPQRLHVCTQMIVV